MNNECGRNGTVSDANSVDHPELSGGVTILTVCNMEVANFV